MWALGEDAERRTCAVEMRLTSSKCGLSGKTLKGRTCAVEMRLTSSKCVWPLCWHLVLHPQLVLHLMKDSNKGAETIPRPLLIVIYTINCHGIIFIWTRCQHRQLFPVYIYTGMFCRTIFVYIHIGILCLKLRLLWQRRGRGPYPLKPSITTPLMSAHISSH